MFEVIIKMKHDWIDLSGAPETELFKAMSYWSSGKKREIKIKEFSFDAEKITGFVVTR